MTSPVGGAVTIKADPTCPRCGLKMRGASTPAPGAPHPEPGDVIVCFRCAGVCIFRADFSLRLATFSDYTNFDADALWTIHQVRTSIQQSKN